MKSGFFRAEITRPLRPLRIVIRICAVHAITVAVGETGAAHIRTAVFAAFQIFCVHLRTAIVTVFHLHTRFLLSLFLKGIMNKNQ